jgi:hypothetical protein
MSWVRKEMIEAWEDEWEGMPEFIQDDLEPFKTIKVHFKTEEDLKSFAALVGQKLTLQTKGIWFPSIKKKNKKTHRLYTDES